MVKTIKKELEIYKKSLENKTIGILIGNRSIENNIYIEQGSENDRSIISIEKSIRSMGLNYILIDTTESNFIAKIKKVDLVLICMHGEYGEDGTIQGLLDFLNKPYSGSRVKANSLGIDKVIFKKLIESIDVPTPKYMELFKINRKEDNLKLMDNLDLKPPYLVKPKEGGSSLGIHYAESKSDLINAISNDKLKYYQDFFIEEFIDGQMVTVGIVDFGDGPIALPIVEIHTKSKFYDEDTKLNTDEHGTIFKIANSLEDHIIDEMNNCSIKIHKLLNCRGVSRIDYILKPNGDFYCLEINTIPGMSKNSNYTFAFKSLGFDYDELVLTYLKSGELND